MTEESPDEKKQYKSYLTRLTKFVSWKNMTSDRMISVQYVRRLLASRGEDSSYLDETWEKRSFSDREFFEPVGDGFFKILMLPKQPPEPTWEGVRPGEDVVLESLLKALSFVKETTESPDIPSLFPVRIRDSRWYDYSRAIIRSLSYAVSRGLNRPLEPMTRRAMEIFDGKGDTESRIAMWLFDSVIMTADYLSLLDHVNGVAKSSVDISRYAPPIVKIKFVENEPTFEDIVMSEKIALYELRSIMRERGILR